MRPHAALSSVILRCDEGIERATACVSALIRHTARPWELIATARHASDAVAAYLRGLAQAAPFSVRIIDDPPPWGSRGSQARGLFEARGDYLAFLDGDAVVTDGWLDQLVALAESTAAIGPVGPMSNRATGPQLVPEVPYRDRGGLDAFAARWRADRLGRWFTADDLSGPCVLIRREVLDALAGPWRGVGDLVSRARAAGCAPAVAFDLFVHAGPLAPGPPTPATPIASLGAIEFAARFGSPDTSRAILGYTPAADTHAVLTLLAHARPMRVLEVGTALGHMAANLSEFTDGAARIFTLGIVDGMGGAGPPEQGIEVPAAGSLGRLVDHFGKADKVAVIVADSRTFAFGRLAPIDFAFIDGAHDLDGVAADSRAAYDALCPGGWLVWHDFGSPHPWIWVREAVEGLGLAETAYRVAGTEVAFLRKDGPAGDPIAAPPPPEPRPRVAWEGDWRSRHSLGLINRALCEGLIDRGHELSLVPAGLPPACDALADSPRLEEAAARPPRLGADVVHVSHRWPPRLEPPGVGRWVFAQPWEFGSLPRLWLPAADRADEVWTYSRSVRACYLEAGVAPEKVRVVPLGVDPDVFRPGGEPMPLPPGPGFRFLFVGGTIPRKGIDLLLAAYERAFRPSDGVGLVVQDMGVGSFYRGQTAGAAIAALRDRGYPVDYRADALDQAALAGLYAACDCLVHPYRGEGFGLPIVEAMACGLPVIATGEGPTRDYAGDATAYLLPARRAEWPDRRVGDLETVGRPWWWEPDPDALVEQMRRVAGARGEALGKGLAASAWIRRHFTWRRSVAAVEARLRALSRRAGGPRGPAPGPPAAGPRARPKVSLTMIVRDEEHNLPACLGSAAGLFDEVVVVDTGSSDRTAEIARAHGARIFDFPWVDDFAAARNAALARATGDYAFWLDADDVLDPPQRERLRTLLDGLRAGDEAAYVVRCLCDDGPGGGRTVVDHVRLFPLREDARWEYAVHEQILPSLRRAGVPVRWTEIEVRHTGYADPAVRAKKLVRDEAILRRELTDRPGDPFVLFNLGFIAVERREWDAALADLGASLAASAPTDSIVRKLHALIARCHQGRGDAPAALAACAAGLACDPEDAELRFREAVVRRQAGDAAGAEACWRRVLTSRRPDRFSSVDAGIYGHLTRRNLAALAAERGAAEESRGHWRAVLAECPGDAEAERALGASR